MVLTRDELIGLLKHEVHILLHLAGKVEPAHLDYRPTPNQRSTRELLQYLSMMGPTVARAAVRTGTFDPADWTAAEVAAKARGLEETVSAIGSLPAAYEELLGGLSDADFRREVNLFGTAQSLGVFLVAVVLAGHVAYRTQIFVYLKACGRAELNTMNLWAGKDAPMAGA